MPGHVSRCRTTLGSVVIKAPEGIAGLYNVDPNLTLARNKALFKIGTIQRRLGKLPLRFKFYEYAYKWFHSCSFSTKHGPCTRMTYCKKMIDVITMHCKHMNGLILAVFFIYSRRESNSFFLLR